MHLFASALYFLVSYCVGEIGGKSVATEGDIEGYYWRHYTGKIPPDALLGGEDSSGNPTYIGQAVFNGALTPGQLNQENQTLYYEWGNQERSTTKNIKILCTGYPEQFEWIRTTTDRFESLQNDTFIYGGVESDFTIYIGRTRQGDELLVGKVLISGGQCKGLNTSKKGKFIRATEFEILNYNPDIPSKAEIMESLANRQLADPNSAVKAESCALSLLAIVIALFLR